MAPLLLLCQDKLFLVHNLAYGNEFDFQDIINMQAETKTNFKTDGETQFANGLFTGIVTILRLGEEKNSKSKPT